MIDKIRLKNFTVFDEIEIDFSSKINLIIGENGTGKTHFLKAAYGLCSGNNQLVDQVQRVTKTQLKNAISAQLTRCFLPPGSKVGQLVRSSSEGSAEIAADFAFSKKLGIKFGRRSSGVQFTESLSYENYSWRPIFLPSKEILSFIKGMTAAESDRATIESLFDATYLDLCRRLSGDDPGFDSELLEDPRTGTVIPSISNSIGGVYELENGEVTFAAGHFEDRRKKDQDDLGVLKETVFVPTKNGKISCELTAEGHRKIGVLQQLIANGSLAPGATGTLFWDEPECNLNPRLIRTLVNAILELARNGQQVVIATHDYVLLKWFDLLSDTAKGDHVRYHALYRDSADVGVMVSSTDEYLELAPNAIDDAFGDLTEEEISQSMGGLGK